LIYADPSLLNISGGGKGKEKSRIGPGLEELLVRKSPEEFIETVYRSSMELFKEEGIPANVILTILMAGMKVGTGETSKRVG